MTNHQNLEFHTPKWVTSTFVVVVLGIIPWIVFLAVSLPQHHVARHWGVLWVGFDIGLTIALLVTVILAIRKSIWTALALMSLFTLFVVDAWFDVLTALPKEQVTAVAMALLAELPLAILALGSAIWIVRQPVRRAQSHD